MEKNITIVIDTTTGRATGGRIQAETDEEQKILSRALDVAIAAINSERGST